MSNWDKALLGLITLALVAVVFSSSQIAPAIAAVSTFLNGLITNVVGTGGAGSSGSLGSLGSLGSSGSTGSGVH